MPSVVKTQKRRVGIGDEEGGDKVIVLRRHARRAFAASRLRADSRPAAVRLI